MPFGYSPEKRLFQIQGYHDVEMIEDEEGIIYGL